MQAASVYLVSTALPWLQPGLGTSINLYLYWSSTQIFLKVNILGVYNYSSSLKSEYLKC